MPPTYFYLFILLTIILHFIFPIKQIINYPFNLLGIILIVLGITIDFSAWLLFINKKTTQNPFKNPNKLIIKGVYKISRNPMYLGMLSILLGLSVLLGSLITFIFPILFIILMEILFIPLEEKNMEKTFGKKYLGYKNKVRRGI